MQRQKPGTRATPFWLVMGLFAGVGCGEVASPPREDARAQTRSSALQFGPDLVVTEVSAPRSLRPGDDFTATVKVCNTGTEPANPYYTWPRLELYLSVDDSLSMPGDGTTQPTDQLLLGFADVPPLDAGQCVTHRLDVDADLPQDAQGDGAYYLGAIVDASEVLFEADEGNNIHASTRVGVGYQPDLVVTALKGPASVRQGDEFTATVTVCNQGTEPIYGQANVELYLSMDDSLAPSPSDPNTPPVTDQQWLGYLTVPQLSAGQCVTRSEEFHASLPDDANGAAGAYYLGAIVDPHDSEQELREDNNAHVSERMGVGYRPDLVVTQVKGPASVQRDDVFTATVTVCNQGTEPLNSHPSVELYLSMDDSLSLMDPNLPPPTDQRMIGHVPMPSLNEGQCVTRAVQVTAWLPDDAQNDDGAYYLGAIVDPHSQEDELREDNNIRVAGLMGVGHGADLVVTQVRGPASVSDGNPFRATVTVCNQGTRSSDWYNQVQLYLSMDTSLTLPSSQGPGGMMPGDQQEIGYAQLPQVGAGQCVTREVEAWATRPNDAQDDVAFYLGAIVDPHQSQEELREDNNAFVGGLMGVGSRPDLVVTALRAPANVRSGDAFTATVTVCNQGTEPTSQWSHQLELYLSMDTTLTPPATSGPGGPMPGDQRMIGSVSVPALNAGQCDTRNVTVSADKPDDAMDERAFYLGAIVDAHHVELELREDNNTFIHGLMGVGERPDLVVTELSAPASVPSHEDFPVTVKVCNQGTEPTDWYSGTRVELYLSMDDSLTPPPTAPGSQPPTDQQEIGSVSLPQLAAGQCVTRTVTAYAISPDDAMNERAFHLGAIVDPDQSQQELREDNNTFVGDRVGVGYAPDLVVTQVTGPASARDGDDFTATVRVCNQGTESTGWWSYTQVRLYLSMDTLLTFPSYSGPGSSEPTDQQQIGDFTLPDLQPGQCINQSVNVYASLPQDAMDQRAFYLAAIVDANEAAEELREDNNITVGGLMGVGYRPDLVVTEVTGPASAMEGTSFVATVKVCNQGTESTSGWSSAQVGLYLSMDTSLVAPFNTGPGTQEPTDQRMIGSVELSQLSAGQCVTRSVNAIADRPDDGTFERAFHLGAIVDPDHWEEELREDNNITVGGLMGVGQGPDLVVTEVTGPASADRDASFTATVKVCNQGTQPTSWWGYAQVGLYLSMDTTLTLPSSSGPGAPEPGDQQLIGSVSVPQLSPGQCVSLSENVQANPPNEAGGEVQAFYLGAIVDAYASEDELREDNNTFAGSLMGVGFRPDLVVTEVTGPASVNQGGSFTATVKVCNQGTTSTGPNRQLEVYLSMDTTLTGHNTSGPSSPWPTDQELVGSLSLPELAAGECTTQAVNAYAHPPQEAGGQDGAWYLGAIADVYGGELELREDNNMRVGGLMGVGSRADLVVTEVSGPASMTPGGAFAATVTVCNQGTETAGDWSHRPQVALYLSTTAELVFPGPNPPPSMSDQQQLINSFSVGPLAAGQCETTSVLTTADTPPDAYDFTAFHLGAIVDTQRSEPELREDNNVTVGGLMGVGNRSDLVVTALTGPASVQRDAAFTASVKVCNQGTEPASPYGNVYVDLYLSTDTSLAVPSPLLPYPMNEQALVGSLAVPPLAPGQCETLSLQAPASPPDDLPGNGAVYLATLLDTSGAEPELREDNNITVGGLMGVGDGADLVVTALSGPTTVQDGASFIATVEVCNQGTAAAGTPYSVPQLELYISMDTALTLPDPGPMARDQQLVGVMQVSPLAAGQCETLSVEAWASLPQAAQGEGAFYLGAIVDAYRAEQELREDNNTRADFALQVTW